MKTDLRKSKFQKTYVSVISAVVSSTNFEVGDVWCQEWDPMGMKRDLQKRPMQMKRGLFKENK